VSTLTLILKPVGNRCQLNCDYCYNNDPLLPNRKSSAVMADVVLEKIIFDFLSYNQNGKAIFIWHGGEPTLAGIDFYRNVISIQTDICNKLNVPFPVNRIQTNGVLIDEDWAIFLKENKFGVGISIDGPKEVHDAHRMYLSGKGSFDDVFKSVEILNKFKVPTAAGAVITKISLENPIRLFTFFSSNFSCFDFSPLFSPSISNQCDGTFITPEEFTSFTIQLFDYWWETDNPRIRIEMFKNYIEASLGYTPRRCSMSNGCHKFLSVDGDGSVFPCGRFAGLPEFLLGNITNNNFYEIQDSHFYKSYLDQAEFAPSECKECKWYFACHNGCTASRYIGNLKFVEKTPYCNSNRIILNHVKNRILESKK